MGESLLKFEWDETKARENIRKHGVSFDEAVTIFEDPLAITVSDADHSYNEQRYIAIGLSREGGLLVVSYTERQRRIRIISSRRAVTRERKLYED